MPEVVRTQFRMDCLGVDFAHPLDRMPAGRFAYLFNTRVLQEGRVEARPGYTKFSNALVGNLHSIRRFNDIDLSHTADGYTYVVGNGTLVSEGPEASLGTADSGYSGDPLSLLTFRPEGSSEHWMYVYDRARQRKLLPDATVREIGVAPPQSPTQATYGPPAWVQVNAGQSVTGWTAGGTTPFYTIDLVNREGTAVTSSISAILYDAGSTGWACLIPTSTNTNWLGTGTRMQVILNTGTGNAETVVVREIHNPITTTTIASIDYDSGTSGLCSLVLTGSPIGLERNSIITLTAENVRVLAVVMSPDGSTYSVRCSTASTHSAGETVTGKVAWYVYTTLTHAAAETITSNCVYGRGDTFSGRSTTASMALLTSVDASKANGRPISIVDDYMHISLWFTNAPAIISVKIRIDVDAATAALSDAFKNNYYEWDLLPADIFGAGIPTAGSWNELLLPLSKAIRVGNDQARNLSNIKAIQIFTTMSAVTDVAFDWWYLFGSYGPTIQPNAPTGYLYSTTDRDSTTGAASVPGPSTRYELFPLREQVLITPCTSSQAGIDSLDVYRIGGTLTALTYVGTVANNTGSPNVFSDDFPDTTVAANPVADLTLIQPWPILQKPRSGVVNVVGTTVRLVSGDNFDLTLLSATVILINGVAYQTYGQPSSASRLEITQDAGTQTNAAYTIASPTLAAQPMPYVFGPLEGPFAPVAFGLGDIENAGTLYYSNTSNFDAASDINTIEICAPSEPLVSGQVWNGLSIVGSRDNLYCVRYSYLETQGLPGPITYQFSRIPALSGMWARWATCRGPDGVYFLGRDGIYKTTEQGADIIGRTEDGTDPLYPLFPHDGQAAAGIVVAGESILGVDMDQLTKLRLTCCDQDIYFDYLDTAGNQVTLRYEIPKRRWFMHSYANKIALHYLVEANSDSPNEMQLLLLGSESGYVYKAGGATDDTVDLTAIVVTPSFDSGDERLQKLYIDAMIDADNEGSIAVALAYNNSQQLSPVTTLTLTGPRTQQIANISSLADLSLYRNVAAKMAWVGGPSGPRVYAFEPSGYLQPYLSNKFVTQFITLGFAGWKHHRRLYPGLISNADVLFTIECQDGRTFGPFTIPSTGGRFKIAPLMLPHAIKDLAFAYQLDGQNQTFALFPGDFTIETKEWTSPDYIELAVFKT